MRSSLAGQVARGLDLVPIRELGEYTMVPSPLEHVAASDLDVACTRSRIAAAAQLETATRSAEAYWLEEHVNLLSGSKVDKASKGKNIEQKSAKKQDDEQACDGDAC